ncbi:PulJ/GspJ family protein [Syntrophomonas palmitatica]|uniref:PulJ/GspJ family protein n=1 Tax=Syntrophomonas palmitatica TaxID=402877 RepID=UPI0006D18847|nr:hypothetical protein [Syntrophomonas palmitatica]
MTKIMRDECGNTLVEFLLSLALDAVIIAILLGIFHMVCISSVQKQAQMDLHDSARSSLRMIEYDLLGAKKFEVISGGYILKLINSENETVLYYMEGEQFYRYGAVKSPIAENADSIKFQIKGNMLEMSLSFYRGSEYYKFVTAITPRLNT